LSQTEQTYQQLQARNAELEAQYQTLQDSYDDEVLLCVSLLQALGTVRKVLSQTPHGASQ